MSVKISEVLQDSYQTYKVNKGSAFFIVFIPALLGLVASTIISSLFNGVPLIASIVSILVLAVTSYMTAKMFLELIRTGVYDFSKSLQPGRQILMFVGVLAVFGIIQLFVDELLIIIFNNQAAFKDLNSLAGTEIPDLEEVQRLFLQILPNIIISFIVILIIRLKFYLASYKAIDGRDVQQAFVESFHETKGKVLTIIVFHIALFLIVVGLMIGFGVLAYVFIMISDLFVILLFLGFFVFVIGFLLPFMILAQVNFYVHLTNSKVFYLHSENDEDDVKEDTEEEDLYTF